MGYSRYVRGLALTFLVISVIFFTQNSIIPPAAAQPAPANSVFATVYPNRTVGLQASSFQSRPPYLKNVNITHWVSVYEFFSGSFTEQDMISPNLLYLGRNSSIRWQGVFGYYGVPDNHTITVIGPVTFNVTLTQNYTSIVTSRFTVAGTYKFQSFDATCPMNDKCYPSTLGQIIVLNSEENEPPTIDSNVALTQKPGEVTLNQTMSVALTGFMKASLPFPFNDTDSFSLTGSYANGQHSGTLNLHFVAGAFFPLTNATVHYAGNSSKTQLTGSVGLPISPTLPYPLNSSAAFQSFYAKFLGNTSWINLQKQQVNASTYGKIQLSIFEVSPPTFGDNTSAAFTFTVSLIGDLLQYLILGSRGYYYPCGYYCPIGGLTSQIYTQILALFNSASYTITYTKSSGTLVVQSTARLVQNLDTQANLIKEEILNFTQPYPPSPQWLFLNSTRIYISNLNVIQHLSPQYLQTEFRGLMLSPPTDSLGVEFQEAALFNSIGFVSSPVNFTLLGGSNGTISVLTDMPPVVPTPNYHVLNSTATWLNFQNFPALAPIRFGPVGHPSLAVVVSTSVTSGRIPLSVQFIAGVVGGTPPYRYSWSFGDGGTSSLQDPVHTYNSIATYIAKVTVTDSKGASATSSQVTIKPTLNDPPTAPPYLQAFSWNNGTVPLSWGIPIDNGGAAISGYKIYRGIASGQESLLTIVSAKTQSFTDSKGIVNGHTYYYQVSAVNSAGEGPRSFESAGTPVSPNPTRPSAPQSLVATAGNGVVALNWQPPADYGGAPIEYYRIVRWSAAVNQSYTFETFYATNGITSYTDGTVTNGQKYYYNVSAINTRFEGPSAFVSAQPTGIPTQPSAPQNVYAFVAYAPTPHVLLSWQPPTFWGGAAITSFKIYRGTSSRGETLLATIGWTGSNGTNYSDTSVTEGKTYYYQVSAVNKAGESPRSYELGLFIPTQPTPPSAPRSLVATAGNAQVILQWQAPSSDGGAPIGYYRIYRGTTSGGEIPYNGSFTFSTSFTDTRLTNGQTYYYRVSAVNYIGESPLSAEVSTTPFAPHAPSAPQSLTATAGNGMVTLNWSSPNDTGGPSIISYVVFRGTTPGTYTMDHVILTGTTLTDTGLVNGQTYYYSIGAVNSLGLGTLANISATPIAPTVPVTLPSSTPTGVGLMTNATITNFHYDQTAKSITFTVSGGATGSIGVANITLPKSLVGSNTNITVYIDGKPITNAQLFFDANNYYVYFTFHFSTHTVNVALGALATSSTGIPLSIDLILIGILVAGVAIGAIGATLLSRRRQSTLRVPSPLNA